MKSERTKVLARLARNVLLAIAAVSFQFVGAGASVAQQQEPINKDPWNATFVPIVPLAMTLPQDPPPVVIDDDADYAHEEPDLSAVGLPDVDGSTEVADP